LCVTQQQVIDHLIVEVSRSHTIRHTHTHIHTHTHTQSSTPLNEWSALRRGRYLHNKHKRFMPSPGFEPASQQPSGSRPNYFIHCTATRMGAGNDVLPCNWNSYADVRGRFSYPLPATGCYSTQSSVCLSVCLSPIFIVKASRTSFDACAFWKFLLRCWLSFEPLGPVQDCNGIALPLRLVVTGDSLGAASASGKWSWPVATATLSIYSITRIAPSRVGDRTTLLSCCRSHDLRAGM
jgi:hypothetical protein